jgi:hypothetical protein
MESKRLYSSHEMSFFLENIFINISVIQDVSLRYLDELFIEMLDRIVLK